MVMPYRIIVVLLAITGIMSGSRAAVVTNYVLHSDSLGRDVNVSMMVPDEYADSTLKQYPVLYCLHGGGAPYTTYTSMGTLKNAIDNKYPMVVVTYGVITGGYTGDGPFFFDELVPYIEANYRVLAGSAKRAITGFSMGGNGAYVFMRQRPDYFSSVSTLSTGFNSSNQAGVRAMAAAGTSFPGLMHDCGTADTYITGGREMYAILTSYGIPMIYGETLGAAHDYTFWNMMSDSCAAVAWRFFDDVPPLTPTGLQGVPTENAVALTWTASAPASDGDGAARYIIHRDGVPVDTVTAASFTDTDLAAETGYDYAVYAVDDAYHASTAAAEVTVTTTVDNDAPVVLEAISQGLTETAVYFDEDVDPVSAAQASNYTLDGGVTVSAAAAETDRKVVLTTSVQNDGQEYTVSVVGVKDVSTAENGISPAQAISFTALATFYDDFESGFRSCWQPAGTATWAIASGNGGNVMSITGSPTDILLLDRTYGTFTLDAAVQAPDASSYRHVKIVFGHTGSLNYYDVDFAGARHASYNGIFQTDAGTTTKLIGDNAEATITDTAVWYNIRVEVDAEAKTVKAYCGDYDTPVFYIDIPGYTGGKIGLWSHRGKYGNFDDIIISQYVRTGTWAPVDDKMIPAGRPLMTLPNPVSLRALLSGGSDVHTLTGSRPDAGYRGIVILKNADGTAVRTLLITE